MKEKTKISARDVADKTGKTLSTVYGWLDEGKLPATKVFGVWQIDPDDLDRFIEENTKIVNPEKS